MNLERLFHLAHRSLLIIKIQFQKKEFLPKTKNSFSYRALHLVYFCLKDKNKNQELREIKNGWFV